MMSKDEVKREYNESEGNPIIENVPLARSLYAQSKVDEFIPADLIEPVAEVLKWVKQLENHSLSS